jgi:polyisoprenoid-binding protein YceI
METQTATTTRWALDPAHSEITFKVRHMMIASVSGQFKNFSAEAHTQGADFKTAQLRFIADVNSIDTGNGDRDQHLKSADFFDAAQFPQVTFESTRFNGQQLEGLLTIRGVQKPIALDVDFGGIGKDPWGNTKAGMTATGTINRKEFGLNWNAALETGGVLVGEDVKIQAEIQLAQQA